MRRSQIIKELGQIMVERNRVNLQARNCACRRVLRLEREPHCMGIRASTYLGSIEAPQH
jgi:hypothetical protein